MGVQGESQFVLVNPELGVFEKLHIGAVIPMQVRKDYGVDFLGTHSQCGQAFVDAVAFRLVGTRVVPVRFFGRGHARVHQNLLVVVLHIESVAGDLNLDPIAVSAGDVYAFIQRDVTPCSAG